MQFDLGTAVVAALAAIATWIFKPVVERSAGAFFGRKPVFAITPHVLRDVWSIKIDPVNGPARRKKPLSLSFQGTLTMSVGKLHADGQLAWTINIASVEILRDQLLKNTFADFQLFFDPSRMSEPIRLTYKPGKATDTSEKTLSSTTVETAKSFIQSVSSNRLIQIRAAELLIDDGFPYTTANTKWNSVFDGKELVIHDVDHFEIQGEAAALLAEPRYSWVLSFENCRDVVLSNLTMGHLSAGYCQGGVIRFKNCSGIKIKDCDLYGSGTYGFEFEGCKDVEVSGVTIRDCSYGILNLTNCQSVTFTHCVFANNKQYDLCSFAGQMDQVMFRKCSFERNNSERAMFNLTGITEFGAVHVWECQFNNNVCARLSDGGRFLSEDENTYTKNTWQED